MQVSVGINASHSLCKQEDKPVHSDADQAFQLLRKKGLAAAQKKVRAIHARL